MLHIIVSILGFVVVIGSLGRLPGVRLEMSQQPQSVRGSPLPSLPGIGIELGLNPRGNIESLLVYHFQQQVQTLSLCTEEPVKREKQVGTLASADFNFDGFSDLALQVTEDKKNNNTFCVWLYDPGTQRFVASPQLSQLTNPVPDPKTHMVASTKYPGCPYCYDRQFFKWSGDQLEPAREESLYMDTLAIGVGGCDYVRTVKEEKDGRLRQVSKDRTNALGGPCGGELY
jgi:hypothetical protein